MYLFTKKQVCSTVLRLCVCCFAICFIAESAISAGISEDIPESIESRIPIRDFVILPKVGSTRRMAFPTDPVTYMMSNGTFTPPQAGDVISIGEGKQVVWTAVTAPEAGPLQHELLLGGWVYANITSEVPRRAILRAKGHSIVYVNGEPRVANVYRYSYVMIPIELQRGENHFLFRCTRYGTLEAWLEPVTHDIMINMEDATLPEAIAGESHEFDAGIVVLNTTNKIIDIAEAQGIINHANSSTVILPSYRMLPYSIAKIPVRLHAQLASDSILKYSIHGDRIQPADIEVAVVSPEVYRNVTFISDIDGSAQYYGYRPPREPRDSGQRPALMLHMHGASDEAFAYRTLYYPKTWCAIASATNRRPFGFNWEDWGRLDAMEVLAHARKKAGADPSRIYLGGHSMGGHGVWINSAIYPDRFAAIGPGAGWKDIWTYAGSHHYTNPTPTQQILNTASNPSRTALLAHNYKQFGVLMIHGDADNVVSINEAYAMRDLLEEVGHDDWTMVIQPGGGHVYDVTDEVGHSCFDQMELFEFFQRHSRSIAPQRIDFTTVLPSINSTCHWLQIEQQTAHLEPSRAILQLDPGRRYLFGTLENIERFSVDPAILIEPGMLTIQFDDDQEQSVSWGGDGLLHFAKSEDGWVTAAELDYSEKGLHRSSLMKSALMANHPLFVVGTHGTASQNKWAITKARFDNETMWYRGNSSFDIIFDTEFDPALYPDRNVILYGNADTNAAWDVLLADAPIRISNNVATVGEQRYTGEDIVCLMVYPRSDSDIASVGCVSGTGLVGMQAANETALFYAGVHYPDFNVYRADTWLESDTAILATGFFGNDWSLESGDSVIMRSTVE